MSQENVEIVRRILALRTLGDIAWTDLVAPGFVLDYSRRLIDPFLLRGLDGPEAAARWDEHLEPWEAPPTLEPRQLIDSGDKVLAIIRMSCRGKASGVDVEVEVAHVITFRDGQPIEDIYFGEDRAAAFEAAGLSE